MAFIFSTSKYSTSVTTSNWIASGHDGTDAMILGGSGKLILSASNGITHLSGALDIGLVPDNKAYHVRSIDGPLILSSSANSAVYISGNLQASGSHSITGTLSLLDGISASYYDARNTTSNYHVRAVNSHLILSSSAGSIIAASGSLDFPNSDKTYHLRAVNSHIILSSSAGSVIYVSGSLFASGSMHTITGSLGLFDGIDERSIGAYHLRSINNSLILSSSANSAVYISGNFQASGSHTLTGTLNLFDGIDERSVGAYHIRSVNSNLTLSSSAGYVVTASGSIRSTGYASASMPSPSGSVPSGTIAYVSDLGFLAIAWNGAWQRLSTGSW